MFNRLSPVYKGILLAFVGYSGFSVADLCAKWLLQFYSLPQLIAVENALAAVMLLAIAPWLGGFRGVASRQNLGLHALRIVLNFGLALLLNYCYRRFPLADVYTMIFTKPFFAALLAVWLFHERGTPGRWLTIIVGFMGVVIAMRPGTAAFDPVLLLPLASAVLIALLFMSARFLHEPTAFAVTFMPMAGAAVLAAPLAAMDFLPVAAEHWPVFLLLSLSAALGMATVSLAVRVAPVAAVTPVLYIQMLWAIAGGYLLFRDKPDLLMLAGSAIIIASGIVLIRSERRSVKMA